MKAAVDSGFARGVKLDHPMVISPCPTVQPHQLQEAEIALKDTNAGNAMLDPILVHIIEIWDPAALRERRLERVTASAHKSRVEVRSRYRNVGFELPSPDLHKTSNSYDRRSWAVVVRLIEDRPFGDTAEVFPPDLHDVIEGCVPTHFVWPL